MISRLKTNKSTLDMLLAGILIIAVLAFLVFSGGRFLNRSPQIYSADIDRIINEHPAFGQAMVALQEEIQQIQDRLDKLEGEDRIREQQLMQQQIQQKAMHIQETAVQEVFSDIEWIARKKGYRNIIDSKVFIVGGIDITEEILAALMTDKDFAAPGEYEAEEPFIPPIIPVR